uniref:Uncharacterized protein n=1 Tax=Varanus komodoensis TaxID=61221 RepID=A0A8D2IX13_VARKO
CGRGHLGAIVSTALIISPFHSSTRASTGAPVLSAGNSPRAFRNPSGSIRVLVGAPLQTGQANETGKLYQCTYHSGACTEISIQSRYWYPLYFLHGQLQHNEKIEIRFCLCSGRGGGSEGSLFAFDITPPSQDKQKK